MLIVAGTMMASEAIVIRKDERRSVGKLISDDEKGVTLEIAGIPLFIPRADIARVERRKTAAQQYRQRRAELKEDDLDGRYELAKWLTDMKAYDLALKELDELLVQFPTDARLSQLRRNAVAQQTTARRDVAPGRRPARPKRDDPDKLASGDERRDPRLTPDQVNLMKVWELNLADKPRVIVPRPVLNDVFEKYGHDDRLPQGTVLRRRFRAWPGYKQLDLLLALDARELLAKVQVRDEPAVLQTFRTQVHRQYVLNYCGTRNCHGAPDAKALRVMRQRPKEERTAYTNLFVLNAYESGTGLMVDRDYPDRSLLLRFSLPPDEAKTPHPPTKGWKPLYRNERDRRYVLMLRWIRSLAKPLRARNYGIVYNPPSADAPTPGSSDTDEPAPATPAVEATP